MKIKRSTANTLMSKAIALDNRCLVALLDADESITYCDNKQQLDELIETHPDGILVYNQNPDALDIVDQLVKKDGMTSIEIFQDTEGVFGLRAYQIKAKLQTPTTLELSELHTC